LGFVAKTQFLLAISMILKLNSIISYDDDNIDNINIENNKNIIR